MNVNYSVNHAYLNLPIFKDKKGSDRQALLLVLSCCFHFTRVNRYVDFYISEFAKDWGFQHKRVSQMLKLLIDEGYLECILAYSRSKQTPGRYKTLEKLDTDIRAYVPGAHKQYPPSPKAVSTGTGKLNLKEDLNPSDNLDCPHDFKKKYLEYVETFSLDYAQKQLKRYLTQKQTI
jgi:hypothetical protein